MPDPRELSTPELNRFIARLVDTALPMTPRKEPDGWRIEQVTAEPEGTGLWVAFGRIDDPDSVCEFRFEYVPDAKGLDSPTP